MMKFRVARQASPTCNVAKTLAQTTVMWSLALWIVPQFIVTIERAFGIPGFRRQSLLGWGVFAIASCLGLWSGWVMAWLGRGTPLPFDTASRMVIAGPYAWVRNPMALAGITQGVSSGLILGSYSVILYALSGGLMWQWLVRPHEEADLLARFGEPYRQYRDTVPCWRPRASRYVIQG